MKPHTKFPLRRVYQTFFLLAVTVLLCSHNLYLKLDTYFLEPNQNATLSLYNGSFEESENVIARDRMLDASLVFQGQRYAIDSSQWRDKDTTITQFDFAPIETATYVVGVSTKARNIALTAEKFNDYLEHDGVLDMLKERTETNMLEQDAVESYEKHVKAIYQVGDMRTNDWGTALGYPIEFVPQSNPYEKYTGDKLDIQLLLEGKPLPNQLVYADYIKVMHNHDHGHDHEQDHEDHDHSHGEDGHQDGHQDGRQDGHTHEVGQKLRTNDLGIVTVDLPEDGIYYLRSIHMTTVTDSDDLTHRSKWATLSFEVTHSHDHDHADGLPTWFFVLGSLIVVVILFLIFKKKS